MYCLMASILFWKSVRAALMLEIMLRLQPKVRTHLPTFPTMVAKMSTPHIRSSVTKANSTFCTGPGTSPMVVRISVDQ